MRQWKPCVRGRAEQLAFASDRVLDRFIVSEVFLARLKLARGDVDAIFAPPTVIAKLSESFGTRRFERVRCVFTGTQTLTPPLYRKAEAMFGPVVRITYGKSECTNPITVLGPEDTRLLFSERSKDAGACASTKRSASRATRSTSPARAATSSPSSRA